MAKQSKAKAAPKAAPKAPRGLSAAYVYGVQYGGKIVQVTRTGAQAQATRRLVAGLEGVEVEAVAVVKIPANLT